MEEMHSPYVVWSNEHHAWWGWDRRGYCGKLSDAGQYSRDDALKICIGARGGRRYNDNPSEVPLLLKDAEVFWPDGVERWRPDPPNPDAPCPTCGAEYL